MHNASNRAITRTNAIRAIVAGGLAATMAVIPLAATASSSLAVAPGAPAAVKELVTLPSVADPSVDRQAQPEDQYAMALGCYTLTTNAGATVGAAGASYTVADAATPMHFEPTQLGKYLLLDANGSLLSAAQGAGEQLEAAVEDVEFFAPVDGDSHLTRTFRDELPAPLKDNTVNGNRPTTPDTHTGAVVAGAAGPSADWRVRQNTDGTFTFVLDAAAGRVLAHDGAKLVLADAAAAGASANFTLDVAEGCAEWPEIELNVDGPVLAGATPWDETRGTIDAHLHLMAYEFLGGELRCGQPWHRYGVTEALGDCPENSLTGAKLAEAVVGAGPEDQGDFDDHLWPEFTVPKSNTLTYEQVYYRWLERAWRGGLRTMTVLLVDNNVLCEVYPYKRNSCNEMDAVRLQAQRVRELVDYLDARAGGPGEGFAQVAETPFEAREIINSGRLALILGIEVSALFDCREKMGVSTCTNEDIVRQLDEVQELGVVQMELVNKFDNALSGVTGDGGTTGIIVNGGNRDETGHYWNMETCEDDEHRDHGTDKHQISLAEEGDGTPFEEPARDELAGTVLALAGYAVGAPAYPVGPHCNAAGLTSQGEFLLQEMAARGMLFDPDHMSARAAYDALDVMEELGYSGIISSHSWAQTEIYERIYGLGGMVTPYAGGAGGFVGAWRQRLGWVDDRYYFGFGYGADTNGLGGQGGPRNPNESNDIDYPFEVAGGAMVDQQVSGDKTYDFNTTGTAHYGLYVDWVKDLTLIAEAAKAGDGERIYQDMLRGPEAYLQVWERAVGVPKDACVFSDGTTDPTDAIRTGMSFETVLRTAGQPRLRGPEGYTYCGVNAAGDAEHVLVSFDGGSTVAAVTARTAEAALPALNPELATTVDVVQPVGRADESVHMHADGASHVHAAGAVDGAGMPASAPQGNGSVPAGLLALLFVAGVLGFGLRARKA